MLFLGRGEHIQHIQRICETSLQDTSQAVSREFAIVRICLPYHGLAGPIWHSRESSTGDCREIPVNVLVAIAVMHPPNRVVNWVRHFCLSSLQMIWKHRLFTNGRQETLMSTWSRKVKATTVKPEESFEAATIPARVTSRESKSRTKVRAMAKPTQ